MTILRNLNEMSREDLIAALEESKGQRELSMKVSPKQAVSIYGLGRFPVTLYAGQWERLLDVEAEIRAFIKANRSKLATKP